MALRPAPLLGFIGFIVREMIRLFGLKFKNNLLATYELKNSWVADLSEPNRKKSEDRSFAKRLSLGRCVIFIDQYCVGGLLQNQDS